MNAADRAVFYWINGWPNGLDPLMRFLSEAINHWPLRMALAILVLVMVVRGGMGRATAIQALIAWPIANGLTDILKHALKWPRPCVELSDFIHRTTALTSYGTASAHAANMAAIATVWTYRLGWRWGSIWIVIATLTGLSRIYMALHYPSEVLFGWVCGVAMGLLVVKIWDAILAHRERVRTNSEADPVETT